MSIKEKMCVFLKLEMCDDYDVVLYTYSTFTMKQLCTFVGIQQDTFMLKDNEKWVLRKASRAKIEQ